jgi:pimeloyl-ACP methyl ester carboxylesterase
LKVYFISGLGADSRVFKHIQLPPGFQPVYLEWIKPLGNESLARYALRLSEGINSSERFALVGLSLGGMIATEIAKLYVPEQVVLISSIPSAHCLPGYYLLGGKLNLHKLIPIGVFKKASFIKRFFTAETSGDKKLIREMIQHCDAAFIRWGMQAILTWKNTDIPERLIHIHGSQDFILPKRFTKATHVIPRGGHLMIMTHAAEINAILENTLRQPAGAAV